MDRTRIETQAIALRTQLCPQTRACDAVPLHRLRSPVVLAVGGVELSVVARPCWSFPHQVWAMTTFEGPTATIWLNVEAWPELLAGAPRTRFSVAHELGHVLFHRAEVEDLFDRAELEHTEAMEREANAFAAELLMPASGLAELRGAELRVDRLSRRFGVSAPMAGRRVAEIDLLF